MSSRRLGLFRRVLGFGWRWARSLVDPHRFEAPARPHLSVETTNICNAACVFCANPVMERRKQPLSMEAFEKLVAEFARDGGGNLDFNATIGEPTLDRNLLRRARFVRQYPQIRSVGFVTTLQWLHRFALDEFFEAGISWLSVSCALSGPERYREFFGVDCYQQMLQNLIRLLEENNARGKPISIYVDVKPTNEPIAGVIAHTDFQRVADLVSFDLREQAMHRGVFVDDWQGAIELPDFLKLRPLYPRAYRPCRMLYKGLNVYSNGKVGACQCRDYEADSELMLGELGDGLQNLWEGEHLQALRGRWRKKNEVPEICRSCRYYMF